MDASIDGRTITTVEDFHRQIAHALDFGPYYGHNLNALWDRLTTDVERPALLIWDYATVSQERLGAQAFAVLVELLEAVQAQDRQLPEEARFTFELR